MKEFQQKPVEVTTAQYQTQDFGFPPAYSSPKKKSVGPDPRFRRVINADTDIDNEKSVSKIYDPMQDNRTPDDKIVSFLKIPNDSTFFASQSLKKIADVSDNCHHRDLSNEVTKDSGFNDSNLFYRECKKIYQCENDMERVRIPSTANLKRSASDCTLNKKKGFGEENEDEITEKVRPYPSATRLAKVHDWMKDYNIFPEKRRSVITVIGQTQTKPFSKILSEINQRRKLAKELDRHALCKAIMESAEGQPDVKNLVAKVDLVLPNGKIIYSTEKVFLRKDSKITDGSVYNHQSMETLDSGDQKKKAFQMIPERDSSVSQIGRKCKTKRSSKKAVAPKEKIEEKGSIKSFFGNFSSVLIWSFLVVLCLSLCVSFFFYAVKPSQTYFLVFKPKTTAWYEKLLF